MPPTPQTAADTRSGESKNKHAETHSICRFNTVSMSSLAEVRWKQLPNRRDPPPKPMVSKLIGDRTRLLSHVSEKSETETTRSRSDHDPYFSSLCPNLRPSHVSKQGLWPALLGFQLFSLLSLGRGRGNKYSGGRVGPAPLIKLSNLRPLASWHGKT